MTDGHLLHPLDVDGHPGSSQCPASSQWMQESVAKPGRRSLPLYVVNHDWRCPVGVTDRSLVYLS